RPRRGFSSSNRGHSRRLGLRRRLLRQVTDVEALQLRLQLQTAAPCRQYADEGVDDQRVQQALGGVVLQEVDGLRDCEGGFVGALGGNSVVHIGDGADA